MPRPRKKAKSELLRRLECLATVPLFDLVERPPQDGDGD
jgi:hypothetical protein